MKEALKLALEALKYEARAYAVHSELQIPKTICEAITAIKEALAQPEQEPAAWLDPWTQNNVTTDYDAYGKHGIPLYTHPPVPTAQPKEPEQRSVSEHLEPVGFVVDRYNGANTPSLPPTAMVAWLNDNPKIGQVLYTTPPQRTLTDTQKKSIARRAVKDIHKEYPLEDRIIRVIEDIEAAHGIKGD